MNNEIDLGKCPVCGTPFQIDDVSWGGGFTEAGTDFWTVQYQCSHCAHEGEGSGWGSLESDEEREKEFKEVLDNKR